MRTLHPFVLILGLSFFVTSFNRIENNTISHKKTPNTHAVSKNLNNEDSEISNDFFKRYSDLKKYKSDVMSLYKNRTPGTIWYDENEISEFGSALYEKAKKTNDLVIPYQNEIDQLFSSSSDKSTLSQTDADLLLSSLYVVYTKKNNADKKKIAYDAMLKDFLNYSTIEENSTVDANAKVEFDQYYKLQDVLKKYKRLEKSSKWKPIVPAETPYKDLRPDAVSNTIAQVRTRLYLLGDLKQDSKSDVYDRELMDAVMKYKVRNGFKPNYILSAEHIKEMNVPLEDKVATLKLNMERCREIAAQIAASDEYVLVNVPSYELVYVKNGKVQMTSPVFVGAPLTKTTIFNGEIDRIVFSPYWTVPQSIVNNELKSKMAADPNYLAEKNMEMVNGQVRQKPGPDNSLGLVKFMFPNPDDIYMHDTPSKTLFDFEQRTFSHGCINVKMAKELAVAMLKDYPEWTQDKIDKAMAGKTENSFKLSKKVPIFITYFTSLVNENGEIGFFPDVYERDSNVIPSENTVADK